MCCFLEVSWSELDPRGAAAVKGGNAPSPWRKLYSGPQRASNRQSQIYTFYLYSHFILQFVRNVISKMSSASTNNPSGSRAPSNAGSSSILVHKNQVHFTSVHVPFSFNACILREFVRWSLRSVLHARLSCRPPCRIVNYLLKPCDLKVHDVHQ